MTVLSASNLAPTTASALPETDAPAPSSARASLRVGLVPYLNAWPVAWGLDGLRDWDAQCMVPSALAQALAAGDIDLALGSSIDALGMDPQPLVLPVSCIASNGPTRTVKLASRVKTGDITQLHCDTDSHTSVALARIVLREQWGIDPELVPFDAKAHIATGHETWPEAVLLIGDKVVTHAPATQWQHHIDLGEAWTQWTGLPFVFALWMLREACADRAESICAVLDRQRRANAMRFDAMVAHGAAAHGWPADIAREYLSCNLQYEFSDAQQRGLQLFVDTCVEHGLVQGNRTLQYFRPAGVY